MLEGRRFEMPAQNLLPFLHNICTLVLTNKSIPITLDVEKTAKQPWFHYRSRRTGVEVPSHYPAAQNVTPTQRNTETQNFLSCDTLCSTFVFWGYNWNGKHGARRSSQHALLECRHERGAANLFARQRKAGTESGTQGAPAVSRHGPSDPGKFCPVLCSILSVPMCCWHFRGLIHLQANYSKSVSVLGIATAVMTAMERYLAMHDLVKVI